MGGKYPVDIPPISNYIPGISDQFPLSSFAVKAGLMIQKHTFKEHYYIKGTILIIFRTDLVFFVASVRARPAPEIFYLLGQDFR
jgi:hypothetical protein